MDKLLPWNWFSSDDHNKKTSNEKMPTTPIQHVLVAVAMEAEAMPFVEHLGLQKDEELFESHLPFLAFSGTHNGAKVTVITNGKDTVYNTGVDNVGTVPAALATYLALHKLKDSVDLLINAGTSGGFKRKGAAIGDVFLTTAVSHHDRRIAIPGFTSYGVGRLDSKESVDSEPSETMINPAKLAELLKFKTGVVSTGNSLDKTEECDKHMLSNDASVKDMEAAAIAWSCALLQKPFLGVKVVTDIVDGDVPAQDEFLANLGTAAKSLQEALPRVLDAVIGKTYSDL
jgi:5'-methylthioadenosine nucleosidase